MCRHAAPAIWLYPKNECDVDVTLEFLNDGFMTFSVPPYQQKWRVHVTPEIAYNKYRERYGDQHHYMFLDYDGVRIGPFQTNQGWCIRTDDFISWQKAKLPEIGYSESEIDSVNYVYGRLLADIGYKEPFLAIYPQLSEIVDQSVKLTITPAPDSINRMWFYIVPINSELKIAAPSLKPVRREGFSIVEIGYLTDHDMESITVSAGQKAIAGFLPPWVSQIRKQYASEKFI